MRPTNDAARILAFLKEVKTASVSDIVAHLDLESRNEIAMLISRMIKSKAIVAVPGKQLDYAGRRRVTHYTAGVAKAPAPIIPITRHPIEHVIFSWHNVTI